MAKKSTSKPEAVITTVKKGEIYETKHQELIEIVSGRLKNEGDLGTSFDAKTIMAHPWDSRRRSAIDRAMSSRRP